MRTDPRQAALFATGRLKIPLMVAGFLALTACTSTNSGLTTVYYTVPGTTAQQINDGIARRGPQNGHAIGTTETRMTPKIKTKRQNGQCSAESVVVLLDITVTLPRWSQLDQADSGTQSGFQGLSKHVERHEQQHVEISQKYARLIEQTLLESPAQRTCNQLLKRSRATFRRLFEEHNQEQRNFDAAERRDIKIRLSSLGYTE